MKLATEPYLQQNARWPAAGRHILAHFNEDTIVVYQAYREAIARHALEHGRFGGPFRYNRMSWIKPNFLWMMYRSGWGTKEGQEYVLGLRLRRAFFEEVLAQAVQSTYHEGHYPTRDDWQKAVASSSVRLQWDPDHDPAGRPQQRRAIQLGLRGPVLEAFGKRELLEVIDLRPFVQEQSAHAVGDFERLVLPVERVYTPADEAVARRLGLEAP